MKTCILNCSWPEVGSKVPPPFCLLTPNGTRHIGFSTGTKAERTWQAFFLKNPKHQPTPNKPKHISLGILHYAQDLVCA